LSIIYKPVLITKTYKMDLTSLIIWILLGAVAGWLAGQIMKGKGFGTMGNILVGIVGSIVGGWLAGQLGIAGAQTGGFNLASIATAVVGSCVLLFVIGLVRKS
jgi:uncharacterized membrane protein YeaQ/YmgE (transglycosylase-associated protein family)